MRIVTPAEYAIEQRLRDKLTSFPLYKHSHWILVYLKDNDHKYISYGPHPNRQLNEGKTTFDVEIKIGTVDILSFFIEKGKTRRV